MLIPTTNNPQTIARISGLLYLLLIPLGVFGILYVPNMLVVPSDTLETIENIIANNMFFRLSIFNAFTTQIVNVFLVLCLYKLLKPVNKNFAALMVIFSLLAVPIALLNELNYAAILILNSLNDQGRIDSSQYVTLVQVFLELHDYGIIIAQIFWGLWLLPMGLLIIDSLFIPKILGLLMLIAGVGYLVDVFNWFIFPEFELQLSAFTFLGEVLLPLWLLIKGVDLHNWRTGHHV